MPDAFCMSKAIHLSIVSPVYRSSTLVDELVARIRTEAAKLTEDFEIILVDDCSPDDSWSKIEENGKQDACVKGIRLSRNFGQHPAILAGLKHCKGELVAVMDCDLQDNPDEIPDLYRKANETHFDLVLA